MQFLCDLSFLANIAHYSCTKAPDSIRTLKLSVLQDPIRGLTSWEILVLHSLFLKGGPGAAVEPTVCNRNVLGSSPSLCTFVQEILGA